ncbi:MAG: valine--tRNA ligase [Bdellovibrionales bacterium]|nr:valine--tRNA ligase [Bdellovibrionales bacterium]
MSQVIERKNPAPLTKSFEPQAFESATYQFWNEAGCFEASDTNAPGQQSFCIVIPPPNVTGVLHMGHALTNTIQDTLVRWRRMSGDNTLWLPGTDHAGIATQTQVEKAIAKEGKGPTGRPLTRHDLGREKFLERTWKWKEEHAGEITNQLKRLGSSLDWKRERFTMDEGCSAAVREVFVRLYEEKLIYRGERIINWCCRCQTALSDLEVIPTDRKGNFWHLRYKIVEKNGTPVKNPEGTLAELIIATTRPETLLGDTAVAVHPEDERYTHLHGKFAVLPLLGRMIPVITDSYVDREFGTGALKITPAHDFNDADLGQKHSLPIISVMGKDGKITAEGGPYVGLKFAEAREKVLADLEAQGLLVKKEDHAQKVGLCQRCDSVAEPMISKQWFVKIEPLAKPAIEAVETGKIEFSPKNWEKTYFEWMRNIRDWCISRQLWWGHQIPAWYCSGCEGVTVSRSAPQKCSSCGANASQLKQDEDVLDTWFSSALWPFATLGWPQKTQALQTFYPTSILETGFDIIFFWVARMIMMGIHFMGEAPFKKVYLHAMVRDEKGEKMSKSKGNVIDPLVLINEHGADPLRFTLTAMAGQGRDIKLSVDRVEGYRAFANKLWNATKFFHLQFEEAQGGVLPEPKGGAAAWLEAHRSSLSPANRWILSRLQHCTAAVEKGFAQFELNESANALYEFVWKELCDWYIEFSKTPLRQGGNAREQSLITLGHVLEQTFRLMHPIMPFVTEELWQSLPWKRSANTPARVREGKPAVMTLMFQTFPKAQDAWVDVKAEQTMRQLQNIVEAIRNFRGENNISPKVEFGVGYTTTSDSVPAFLKEHHAEILALCRIQKLELVSASAAGQEFEAVIPIAEPLMELRISLSGLVNVEEEVKRVKKEMEKVGADLEFVRGKLSKESFTAKAPPALIEKERQREREFSEKLTELSSALSKLEKLSGKTP